MSQPGEEPSNRRQRMEPTLQRQFDEAACIMHQRQRDLRERMDREQSQLRGLQRKMAQIQQHMETIRHDYNDLPAEEHDEHEQAQMNRTQAQLCHIGTQMIDIQEQSALTQEQSALTSRILDELLSKQSLEVRKGMQEEGSAGYGGNQGAALESDPPVPSGGSRTVSLDDASKV